MKYTLDPRTAELTFWLTICASLAGGIGYETNWGQNLKPESPKITYEHVQYAPATLITPPPIGSTVDHLEMVERPLFVFTRRPAPQGVQTAVPTMRKGQYKLVGITIVGEKKIAFLTEISSGKMRTTEEGSNLGEISVANIQSDRVRLTQGNDEEFIVLKVEPTKPLAGTSKTPQGPSPNSAAPDNKPLAPSKPTVPPPVVPTVPGQPAPQQKETAAGKTEKTANPAMDFDSAMRGLAAERAKEEALRAQARAERREAK